MTPAERNQRVADYLLAARLDRAARVRHWKAHWRMEVCDILHDFCCATLLGVALGLSIVIRCLEALQ